MTLHALSYFFFLILAVLGFNLIKEELKKNYLIFISFFFFSILNVWASLIVLVLSYVTFFCYKKQKYLLGIGLNIASLITLKFLEFSWDDLSILPVFGLAFYSLQNTALLVEGKAGNIRSFLIADLLLWNCFFPKQMSGPILSVDSLPLQINKSDFRGGIERIILGLFKKLVIADRINPSVDSIFNHPIENPGITQYTAIILFFIQLYFDFSGYVDIAIGSGKLFGFHFPENFRLPLRSKTVTEFWKRWHITLMKFLVEYVFYPLAYYFRKNKIAAIITPVFGVFLLSGWWSGLGLKYTVCVSLFSMLILLENALKKYKPKVLWWKYISWFISFHLLAFSFLFFGARNVEVASQIFVSIFNGFFANNYLEEWVAPLANGGQLNDQFNWILTLLIVLFSLGFERRLNKSNWSFFKLLFLTMMIVLFANWSEVTQFIYMQFS